MYLQIVLLLLCVLARPGENVQISSNYAVGDDLPALDKNVAKITLGGEVKLSISGNQVKLTSNSDRVLLQTSTGSILVSNFSMLSLNILGSNHSNDTNNHPNPFNPTEPEEPTSETPTDSKPNKDELLLANSTRFKDWLNSTNLFHGTVITLFNITNYQAVLNGSIPVLHEEEFRFEQKRTIQVLGWEDDERFLQVKQIKHYTYVSLRDLETKITTINYPLIVSGLDSF